MTIIQAREAAMAGRAVISPSGIEFDADSFVSPGDWGEELVFGEWREKREPRVYWLNIYEGMMPAVYKTKEEAELMATAGRIACVKFIEVIDEA